MWFISRRTAGINVKITWKIHGKRLEFMEYEWDIHWNIGLIPSWLIPSSNETWRSGQSPE